MQGLTVRKKLSFFFCASRIIRTTEFACRWWMPVGYPQSLNNGRKKEIDSMYIHTSLSLEIQGRLATHAWDWPIYAISSRGEPDIFDEKVRDKLDYETVVPRQSVIGPRKTAHVPSRDVSVWRTDPCNRLSRMCAREIWRERERKERKREKEREKGWESFPRAS